MGAAAAIIYNRAAPRSLRMTLAVAVLSVMMAGASVLLFALEGVLCVAMTAPLATVVAIFGATIGWIITNRTQGPHATTAMLLVMVLPALAGFEAPLREKPLIEVATTIEIDAPPAKVWPHVIGFSELPPPSRWVDRVGIAYPTRAHLRGRGVGAVRHCEFSTGPFVEPITVWEPPRRLAFDVTKQPPAMKHISPYRHVHNGRVDTFLRSRRGEFRLVPLPGGRTRLEGSTWYELDVAPHSYWSVLTDALIHGIHERVLKHIKTLAERDLG